MQKLREMRQILPASNTSSTGTLPGDNQFSDAFRKRGNLLKQRPDKQQK